MFLNPSSHRGQSLTSTSASTGLSQELESLAISKITPFKKECEDKVGNNISTKLDKPAPKNQLIEILESEHPIPLRDDLLYNQVDGWTTRASKTPKPKPVMP